MRSTRLLFSKVDLHIKFPLVECSTHFQIGKKGEKKKKLGRERNNIKTHERGTRVTHLGMHGWGPEWDSLSVLM